MTNEAKPVWLETWAVSPEPYQYVYRASNPMSAILVEPAEPHHDGSRLRLAAAAPALVRALLAVEWEARAADNDYLVCCLDDALTAAGLETQEQRDEARKLIAGRK